MESRYATSYCPLYLTSSWVGPTLPSLTEVLFWLFLPLCLMVHEYHFPCHLSVFSLNFTIVLWHVLLLNVRSQPTRPYTINTRPYFSPTVILAKNRPGDEATIITALGWKVLPIQGDGNCLFHAFGYYFHGSEIMHCKTQMLLSHYFCCYQQRHCIGCQWCQKPCPEDAASHSVGNSSRASGCSITLSSSRTSAYIFPTTT